MNRNELLESAQALISGERHQDYGEARDNFADIGQLWERVLGVPVSPEQYALCMVLVKVARLVSNPGHEDSWLDICGYAALGGEIATT